jgi:hypothetical protein
MPWVGFEHTIPASERAKTVHALDRSATVAGIQIPLARPKEKWHIDAQHLESITSKRLNDMPLVLGWSITEVKAAMFQPTD